MSKKVVVILFMLYGAATLKPELSNKQLYRILKELQELVDSVLKVDDVPVTREVIVVTSKQKVLVAGNSSPPMFTLSNSYVYGATQTVTTKNSEKSCRTVAFGSTEFPTPFR